MESMKISDVIVVSWVSLSLSLFPSSASRSRQEERRRPFRFGTFSAEWTEGNESIHLTRRETQKDNIKLKDTDRYTDKVSV